MAGSLNHLITEDGAFSMDLIENMGDAHEALEDCFDIIAHLAGGDREKLAAACRAAGSPVPEVMPVFGARGAR